MEVNSCVRDFVLERGREDRKVKPWAVTPADPSTDVVPVVCLGDNPRKHWGGDVRSKRVWS